MECGENDELKWLIKATVALHNGSPVLKSCNLEASAGLQIDRLQTYFRWQTPLDIVTLLVPQLMEQGIDIYQYDLPSSGYPDVAEPDRNPLTQISEEFLTQIATAYLDIGRGYSSKLAMEYGVSRRTVVSWIEKARKRGILSPAGRGQFKGRILKPQRPSSY